MFKKLIASVVITALIAGGYMAIPARAVPAPEGTLSFKIHKDMICSTPKEVINSIIKDYGELPIFATPGDDEVNIALFMNGNTQTWTLVQFLRVPDEEEKKVYEYACIIEVGTGGKIDLKNLAQKNV